MTSTMWITKEDAAKAVEDLAAVKTVLVKNGWHQGTLYGFSPNLPSDECPVCLVGAIRIAVYGGLDRFASSLEEAEAIGLRADRAHEYLLMATGAGYLPKWNDAEGRTSEEVYAAIDKALELAKADAA